MLMTLLYIISIAYELTYKNGFQTIDIDGIILCFDTLRMMPFITVVKQLSLTVLPKI